MGIVRPKKISSIKSLFGNLAQTSHYQVIFGGLPTELVSYLLRRGVSLSFISEKAGLLCFNASLPTTSFSPKSVDGNFTGITEKFAVARNYSEIGLDFYVDSNYQTLKFLEHWMEFIASGSHNPINSLNVPVSQLQSNYYIRMQYPEYYKSNYTKIIKFDRDYLAEIQYNFVGLWPVSMSSPNISYVDSDILKVSASFQYDRYIAGPALSINQFFGNSNNQDPTNPINQPLNRTPVPPGSGGGVLFRPTNITTTEAIVSGQLYNNIR